MTLNFEFPWQDLLTLPLPPELEQVEGDYVGHRLLRETMLEASTALALCPDPERDYPGGLEDIPTLFLQRCDEPASVATHWSASLVCSASRKVRALSGSPTSAQKFGSSWAHRSTLIS